MNTCDIVPLIQFAIAGVQKAGTTALAKYIDQHEDLYLPPTKELHIFRHSPATKEQLAFGVADKYQTAPRGKLWGEATPLYMYWPNSLSLMACHNPNMKIIVSLRHPVTRAYSAWSMEQRRGRETESFSYCIREGRRRVADAPGGVHLRYSYVERGFYAGQICRLFSIFPRPQIFFIRSDHINANHPRLQDLLDFLEVERHQFTEIKGNIFPSSLENSPKNLTDDFAYLQSLYADDLSQLSDLTSLDVTGWCAGPPKNVGAQW